MRLYNKITLFAAMVLVGLFLMTRPVSASEPLDEIENYEITVDVNEDATLSIHYSIDWKVLEDKLGSEPLEWVQIGLPNSHCIDYKADTDTISSLETIYSDGYYMRVDFSKLHFKGETVHFEYTVTQGNMYQVNKLNDGYTVYSFTPGWFDECRVDNLTINWNADKADSWTPDCFMDNGYLTWNTSLDNGEKYTVTVTYPNDAYAFDAAQEQDEDEYYDSEETDAEEVFWILMILLFSLGFPMAVVGVIVRAISSFCRAAGFGTTQKKITRTKITYYSSCPGCGAVRKEGEQFCTYCGRSFVKSEEKIDETKITPEDKEILKYKKDGVYKYSTPDTYIRVHCVPIVAPPPHRSSSSGHSSFHSSCVHSSCACACACACAGGGRAGCTAKDFYNTDLKLKALNDRLGG